ncbi:hypothetical protein Taro_006125, partial [Colocasia esculenta]|nr:hypothetical protein [Colocasia esculenta]
LAPSSGSRKGDCRDVVPIASMSGSASYCDRGYVAFLKATYPLSPSGLMDCDRGCVAFLKATWPMSPSHRWNCDRGYVVFLKATHPLSPSGSQCDTSSGGVGGCLPRVEAAVLRRVSLRSCRGRVRAVWCEEETFLPTRRPQRVRSSRGELSWLVWDAEDSLEFYPAQASQSFFSLPRSLRPRNRLERTWVEDKTSVDAPDRLTSGVVSVASVPCPGGVPSVCESSQQRQGVRRAEETGR